MPLAEIIGDMKFIQSLFLSITLILFGCSGSGAGVDVVAGIGVWTQMLAAGVNLTDRAAAMMFWTGTEFVFWGGDGVAGSASTGAFFNPSSNTWTAITNLNAPAHRTDMYNCRESVAGGDKLIAWGGRNADGPYADGGTNHVDLFDGKIFDSSAGATGTWYDMKVATQGKAYAGRAYLSCVWTGTDLLIFGGNDSSTDGGGGSPYSFAIGDDAAGSIYNPGASWTISADDTWTAMSTVGIPTSRKHAAVVWTGVEMYVFGGMYDNANYYNDLYSFTPGGAGTWTILSNVNAPTARRFSFYAWTGTDLIVWGGFNSAGVSLNTGAIYNKGTNTWTTMSTVNAPSARATTTKGVWTGTHFVVFGGIENFGTETFATDGGIYDPVTDTWTTIPATGLLSTAAGKRNVYWNGTQLLVQGGWTGGSTYTGQGAVLELDDSFVP